MNDLLNGLGSTRALRRGFDTSLSRTEGEYYLIFCSGTGAKTVQEGGTGSYTVESLDLWGMTVTSAGAASPGPYSFTPPNANVVCRFVATS